MVEQIELVNFRSYPQAQFEFGSGATLIVGPNASGKTNLLEAVFLLCATKSFRAGDPQLIHAGQDFYKVSGRVGDTEYTLTFQEKAGTKEKQAKKNGRKQSLTEYLGHLQAVLFEPNNLSLPSGPPERRRRYLDYILCQTDRAYLKELIRYRKILKQRNRLLESFNIGSVKGQIFAWDLQLAEAASQIYSRRQGLVDYFNATADELYAQIAGSSVGLKLEYRPAVIASERSERGNLSAEYADNFLNALVTNLTTDLAAGFTTIGPHREDFRINFGSKDANGVASRGEMRTAILVLKLAELAYTEEKSGQKPILLLDDVFSELDAKRRSYLVRRLKGYQTLITATEAEGVAGDIKDFTLIETTPTPSSRAKRGNPKKLKSSKAKKLATKNA